MNPNIATIFSNGFLKMRFKKLLDSFLINDDKSKNSGNKNILTVRIRGGLGNQLFCYAAAISLSKINNLLTRVDCDTGFIGDKFNRGYVLNAFGVDGSGIKKIYLIFSCLRVFRVFFRIYYFVFNVPLQKRTFLVESWGGNVLGLCHLNRDVYLDGYWQDSKFLFQNRQLILLNIGVEKINTNWIKPPECSVAVHFRRDAISEVLSPEYYKKAIRLIKSKVRAPHFYVFSYISLNVGDLFLEGEYTVVDSGYDPAGISDFRKMTQCSHFIIANSTFSWWASFLATNEKKVVIMPRDIASNLRVDGEPNYYLI